MKGIYSLVCLFFLCFTFNGIAQNATLGKNFPTENINLHTNTDVVFAGENLLYKMSVTIGKNNSPAKYSKFGYIKLIGPNKNEVLKQKIKLDKGIGFADFLVPTGIPSGHYKLLAYTKLSLFQKTENLVIKDLVVINPYIPIDQDLVSVVDTILPISQDQSYSNINSNIRLELKDDDFGKRKKVELKIQVKNPSDYGDYSISVRKKGSYQVSQLLTQTEKPKTEKDLSLKNSDNLIPELRGNLISGSIISDKDEAPVQFQSIALLIPEENYILKLGRTDELGRFYFNINQTFASTSGYLQVINNFSKSYTIEIQDDVEPDLSFLSFDKISVSKSFEKEILDRSIKNQIENSYSSVKQNVVKEVTEDPFFGNRGTLYKLDDFTRFPTLNETFIEIISEVGFRKIGGKNEIKVRSTYDFFKSPLKALVLVDGLLIQDHSTLYDYNAKSINTIRIITDKYYYGGNVFQGVVSIKTKNEGFRNLAKSNDIKSIGLLSPELKKQYHKVSYDGSNGLEHIPDFRTQLFWNPNLKIGSEETAIDFYTSDEPGVFEITLEGITTKGKTVISTREFRVK